MQNYWNLYLAYKQRQLYKLVNYRDFQDHIPPTNEKTPGFKPSLHIVHDTTCKQDPQEFPATIEKQYIDHIKKVEMLCCLVVIK